MKIKLTTIVLLILLSSCSNETLNDIYGVWFAENGDAGFEITVNSATTAVNPFVSNGNIAISGSVNQGLKYMWKDDRGADSDYLFLSNYPITRIVDIVIYVVIDLNSAENNLKIYIYNAEGNITVAGNIDYEFDGTTLTIDDYSITTDDVQLTLNGSNSLEFIELSASTPTKFIMSSEAWYNEPRTLNIKSSDIVVWTQTLNYNGDLDLDAQTITMRDLWGYDELVYDYELLDNNTLLLSLDAVICDTEDADCLAGTAWNLNIDPTIIESISLFDESEFRSAD